MSTTASSNEATRLSYGCCAGLTECVHQLKGDSSMPQGEGLDTDNIRRTADERKNSLRSPSRRSALGWAGMLGLGSLAPLAGCATSGTSAAANAGDGNVAGSTPLGKRHELPSNKDTVRVGAMDPKAPAAVTVDSGDWVHYPDTWVNWADEAKYGMPFDAREPIRKRYPAGPYSLVGPVAVRGAEPGDWIECRMLRLRPIEWGWNSSPLGVGALPTEFKKPYLQYFKFDDARKQASFKNGIAYELQPTQGVIAAMPAGNDPVSGILSGAYGGNIVLRELTEGASIFLPVQRAGGMIWTGDSHAAQGDGVVNQTAIETAMEDMRIQFILHKRSPLKTVMVETPTHWIGLGYGDTLEAALTSSLLNTMNWLAPLAKIERDDVYSLVSVAGSVRVTQYSHQTNTNYTSKPPKGVHTMVPKNVFTPDQAASISRQTRTGS